MVLGGDCGINEGNLMVYEVDILLSHSENGSLGYPKLWFVLVLIGSVLLSNLIIVIPWNYFSLKS